MYKNSALNILTKTLYADEWRAQCVNLIASENAVSRYVKLCVSSDFMGRYAEGDPEDRYYQGTKYIDEIELDVSSNLKKLFGCSEVEVRPISGTQANEIVFHTLLHPGDTVMVNSTSGGGHISHYKFGSLGKITQNIIDIPLAKDGYHLDVEKTKDCIYTMKPKVIVLGKSLFLFPEPLEELKDVCYETGTVLVYDAAHVLGLIAGKRFQNPLKEGADIITASTHKTFPGTQRGVILGDSDGRVDWKRIRKTTFPGSTSNTHLNTLAGLAIAVYEMLEFGEEYADQTIKNAKALARSLDKKGFDVQAKEFDYTESHQIAVDVSKHGGGKRVAKILEENNIIVNKNLLPLERNGDPKNPKGIRIGVQEMTRFGMKEDEMEHIADLMKDALEGMNVRDEVIRFRRKYQKLCYCFD